MFIGTYLSRRITKLSKNIDSVVFGDGISDADVIYRFVPFISRIDWIFPVAGLAFFVSIKLFAVWKFCLLTDKYFIKLLVQRVFQINIADFNLRLIKRYLIFSWLARRKRDL